MGSLYKLQAKAWFSNWANKMDFIMTFLFLAILGSFIVFSSGIYYGDSNEAQLSKMNLMIISSISLMMVASSAINTFGMSFFEIKDSVLLKRIGATNITKMEAVVAFILWGMTSMVFILGWMALIVGICQIPFIASATGGLLWVQGSTWAGANWAGVFVAIIITMVSFYAIAFFWVSVAGNSMAYQMIATFYFFLISFLGGAYTPNADIAWMNAISFLSPLGWGTDLMTASLQGADVFNFSGYDVPAIMDGGENVSNFFDQQLAAGNSINEVIANYNNLPFVEDPIIVANDPDLIASLDATFTQEMADSMTVIFKPTKVSTLNAIGNFMMPVTYGVLAGGFAAKFFKWD